MSEKKILKKKTYYPYLTIEVMNSMERLANEENRSLSNYLDNLLKEYLKSKKEKVNNES